MLLVCGGAYLWTARVALLESGATRALERAGYGPVRLKVQAVDLGSARVGDVQLRGGAIQAQQVALAYSPWRLITGQVDRIEVAGLRVALSAADDQLMLGGKPLGGSGGSSGSLPVDAITLRDAALSVDLPSGRIEATLPELQLKGADLGQASFTANLVIPVGSSRYAVRVVVPHLSLQPQEGGVRLVIENGAIEVTDPPWSVTGLTTEAVLRNGQVSVKASADTVLNRDKSPLVAPFKLTAAATMTDPDIAFDIGAQWRDGPLRLDVKGRHDRKAGRGSATVDTSRAVFEPRGLQPVKYFPALDDLPPEVAGAVWMTGGVRWQGSALTPDLVLHLADVAMGLEAAQLNQLNGAIRFDRWPLATPPGQVLTATVEAVGLPPAQTMLRFQLSNRPALQVEGFQVDIAGGRISAAPFSIDPAAPSIDTTLGVERLDLAEMFKLIDVDGLGGTGRLSGRIPLELRDGTLAIIEGKLNSEGAGVISVRNERIAQAVRGGGQGVDIALAALADFHYDSLEVQLSKHRDGEGSVRLRIEGSNPAALAGRRVNFNINFESNFDRLTGLALRGMTTARELLSRGAERMK